ncbi:hypothetical protein M0R45_021072 [Rubus argutus]|uniref:Uncharacterized protein n=1 Tax=Rubus argutus TaxID=59490 RepID=A0AAW1XAD8_RUBAR
MKSCCLTLWCPCVAFGRIADIVGQGAPSCLANGAMCLLVAICGSPPAAITYSYRTKMRQQYGFDGTCCGDFLLHCLCPSCALCQEYRELQSRGWHGNMGGSSHEVGMGPLPPQVEKGMSRNK